MRSARGLIAVLVGLTIGLGALTVGSSPAYAASGSTSSTSGVLYPSCLNHSYRYSLSLPAGAVDWDLSVNLLAPDGTAEGSDYLYAGANPASGASSFLFCGFEMAGRYTIQATGEWYDNAYNAHPFAVPNSSFVMRHPRSRTQLRVSDRTPRRGQVVRFRIKVTDERPRGFFRTQYARVLLQHKVRVRWVTYRWSRTTTNNRGVVTLKARFRGKPVKVRARTLPNGYTSSYSRVIRLHR